MKNFFQKNGIMMLAAVTVVAVLLCVASALSSQTGFLQNAGGVIASPFRAVGSAVSGWFSSISQRFEDVEALQQERMVDDLALLFPLPLVLPEQILHPGYSIPPCAEPLHDLAALAVVISFTGKPKPLLAVLCPFRKRQQRHITRVLRKHPLQKFQKAHAMPPPAHPSFSRARS